MLVRSLLPLAGLCIFCGVLFLHGLGDRDLLSSHEARAAQNAQMILTEGHWLVPRLFDRHLELQKPPLYYWLVAGIAWLRGGPVDVWAVRLPATLSAFATVLFLYFLGIQTGRKWAGLLAALILASCLHFTWLARVGRIDMPLTLAITVAMGAFHLAALPHRSGKGRFLWQALGYTALGAGLLLKGPIAVVLPAAVVSAVWLYRSRESRAQSPESRVQREEPEGAGSRLSSLDSRLRSTLNSGLSSVAWGIPWMLAIAAPWYIWANAQTNNQLWEVFFWYHNVERGLGGAETLKAHPFWFYVPRMIVDLLPWSLAIPLAVYGLFRHADLRKDTQACQALIWFGAIFLFLSCMSFKRADYLLPAYPGMAIFLGACAERWWQKLGSHVIYPDLARAGFVGILLACVLGWLIQHAWSGSAEQDWSHRNIAREIRVRTTGPIIFFRAESHVLAFHVGQPLTTVLEWENLDIWANKPFPVFVVMPEACARVWRQHLATGVLEEVLRTSDYGHGQLVVMRNLSRPIR